MATQEHWYQLKVRPGFEKLVFQRLMKQGIEVFVPEREVTHPEPQTSLRPGDVYCRFALDNEQLVIAIPGVLGIAGCSTPPGLGDVFLHESTALRR